MDESSARRRDLYLTTHNTHTRQTSMPPVGKKTTVKNNNNGYSALGPVWQESETRQTTDVAPIRCILGKFLAVVCHCFPPIGKKRNTAQIP